MIAINSDLEEYILNHIQEEGKLLEELNRETHIKILHPRMLSGHLQGKILEMLCKMIQPHNILEIGTYTGYSAISMAKGLPESGKLHTIEVNDELLEFTRKFVNRSGLKDKIELHIGDALKIIPTLGVNFDLVFIDGDKREYLDYYHIVIDRVNEGGFIIADNVLWSGKVAVDIDENDEYTKGIIKFNKYVHDDPRVENVIFPIRDGLMVLRKL